MRAKVAARGQTVGDEPSSLGRSEATRVSRRRYLYFGNKSRGGFRRPENY
jgi:hypothetical protein